MWNKAKLATAGGVTVRHHRDAPSVHLPLARAAGSFLRRVRWRRLAMRIASVAAILAVSYLVIANVLLRTRLLRGAISGSSVNFAITGNSTELRLDYASA